MSSIVCYEKTSKSQAILSCLSFAILYVGSLYVRSGQLPRDHPKTIRQRIIRVTLASICICYFVYQSSTTCQIGLGATFFEWIGFRCDRLFLAMILPCFLIALLFLGPIVMFLLDYGWHNVALYRPSDIMFWRNYVVAPLSEELVFRGCMLPLLVPSFGRTASIFIAPWFFGLAHFHHAFEQYKQGHHTITAIAVSTIFQASYTTIFGILTSFFFLRTGHLIGPFTTHALCNMLGFPDFDQALTHPRKYLVCICFVVGLVLFLWLLWPLTEPSLFNKTVYHGL